MTGFSLPDTVVEASSETKAEINAMFADMYQVIVHDDDVTTFATVITALVQLFDHDVEEAEGLAMQVHRNGTATAAVLEKAEAEAGVKGLQSFKITASMKKV